MPYLELSSGQRLCYEIDNWSDAWKQPESVVMIHGFTEQGMRSWARMTMPPRLGSRMPRRGIDWWVDMRVRHRSTGVGLQRRADRGGTMRTMQAGWIFLPARTFPVGRRRLILACPS